MQSKFMKMDKLNKSKNENFYSCFFIYNMDRLQETEHKIFGSRVETGLKLDVIRVKDLANMSQEDRVKATKIVK